MMPLQLRRHVSEFFIHKEPVFFFFFLSLFLSFFFIFFLSYARGYATILVSSTLALAHSLYHF